MTQLQSLLAGMLRCIPAPDRVDKAFGNTPEVAIWSRPALCNNHHPKCYVQVCVSPPSEIHMYWRSPVWHGEMMLKWDGKMAPREVAEIISATLKHYEM